MTKKNGLALMLACTAILNLATPVFAAERTSTRTIGVTASDGASHARTRAHVRYRHTHLHRWSEDAAGASAAIRDPWYGSAFESLPGSEAYAQGSWHLNANGNAYQVPYDCAYPQGYDSGGAAIFQRYGCPLP